MKITFARVGQPDYVVTVPPAAVLAADAYAQRIGKANTEHLICRFLLDNLLCGSVIPQTQLSQEHAAALALIEAEAAEAKARLEAERLKPFLPELTIGGQVITLPEIEAQVSAAREAALQAAKEGQE